MSEWLPWVGCERLVSGASPYRHEYVEAKRLPSEGPMVLKVSDMAPEMNLAGLWWRPAEMPLPKPPKESE